MDAGGCEMTDNLCESCDHWKVTRNPLGCKCKAGVEPQNTYRSVYLGCKKYKCEREEKTVEAI